MSIKQIYNYKCRDKNDDYLINQSLSYNLDGIISDDKDLKDNNIQNKNFRIISLSEIEAL
ncbi:hypothetical protein FACS189459_6020 [Bacilli bacterium]|nr:hypothetical protein FACS189459_6020 [Bacilli bacterium]